MQELLNLIGREEGLEVLIRELFTWARRRDYAAVGAVRITCADETERECAEAFQRGFVDSLLPRLKIARHAPLALANLGGRYEAGAIALAEDHFATTEEGKRLLVVKANSHVGVQEGPEEVRFGRLNRYGRPSVACGALHALLAGERNTPYLKELAALFTSDGIDRLTALGDPRRVRPEHRSLLAAVVNSLLQTMRAVAEIEASRSAARIDYLMLPAVTVNREDRDGEILCGLWWIESTSDGLRSSSWLLPDRPELLRVASTARPVRIVEADADRPPADVPAD